MLASNQALFDLAYAVGVAPSYWSSKPVNPAVFARVLGLSRHSQAATFAAQHGLVREERAARGNYSMKRTTRWAIPIMLVVVVVAYGLISYLIASALTSVDRKDQEDHPDAHGLRFEEVKFVSRKGDVNLRGWYLPGDERRPTLIFVHGIGSIRTGDNAMALAARLVSQGYNVLLFDLRAHGSSGGDKVTGGVDEQQDVLGAFDFLVARGTPSTQSTRFW